MGEIKKLKKRGNLKECIRIDQKCMACGAINDLTPHHILFGQHAVGDCLWNLITLCWHCHRNLHDGKDKTGKYFGYKKVMIMILKRLKELTGFRWMDALKELERLLNEN